MTARPPAGPSRRTFILTWLVLPAPLLLAACGPGASIDAGPARVTPEPAGPAPVAPAQPGPPPAPEAQPEGPAALQPTPACADADDLTPQQTEGPYFKPSSPARASLLEPGMGGTRIVLTGRVLATNCRPVARALLDFWQADARGAYDNAGFRLRGHQFSDEQGQYRLETVVPGLYPGRTRHRRHLPSGSGDDRAGHARRQGSRLRLRGPGLKPRACL